MSQIPRRDPWKSNILTVDAVFLVYFILTANAIWCCNAGGKRHYGELLNSPHLAKLYNEYIICFYRLGCFCRVFIFYLNLKLLLTGESILF